MSKVPGQGKNQSDDLQIPKLGADSKASGTIVQPGEEPSAVLAQQAGSARTIEQFVNESAAAPAPAGLSTEPPLQAKEMSQADLMAFMANMSQQMAALTNMVMAKNNPVNQRRDRDQEAEVPMSILDMPIEGDIDKMRRPDQRYESVDIDIVANMDHAEQMAFLEELVCINIAETSEEGAENPVPLWVNGRGVAILRGQDTVLKRKYVELLLRAKPEGIKTKLKRNGEGDVKNLIEKTRALKYPFAIVRDDNPKGLAWARKIRSEA
jgi:hypothetical protein